MLAEPGPRNQTTIQVGCSYLKCELCWVFVGIVQYGIVARSGIEVMVNSVMFLLWTHDVGILFWLRIHGEPAGLKTAAPPCLGWSFQASCTSWPHSDVGDVTAGIWPLKEKPIICKVESGTSFGNSGAAVFSLNHSVWMYHLVHLKEFEITTQLYSVSQRRD